MTAKNIYEMKKYNAPMEYIVGNIIREYDISSANINILKRFNYISDEVYDMINSMDKKDRVVYVGKWMKNDPSVYEKINSGMIQVRKEFIESNDITLNDIYSINNDAIYLIDKTPNYLNFQGVNFVPKNKYNVVIKLMKKEYLYYYDRITGEEYLDIKGINKDKLEFHKNHMIDFLTDVFNLTLTDINSAVLMLSEFYNKYINRELSIEYYRRLDGINMYDFNVGIYNNVTCGQLMYVDEKNIKDLNISYNLHILMQLQRILTTISMNNKRR